MKITVLGSGDTRGVPKLGCRCSTCVAAKKTGFERTRFGVVVEEKGTRVLIDVSPDIRRQLLRHGLGPSDFEAVLLSHEHFDHVGGLGEFFFTGKTIPLYGLDSTLARVFSEHNWGYLLNFKLFDPRASKIGQPFTVGALDLVPLDVEHSTKTQGFLINGRVAVLTDCRPSLPKETLDAISGVDLLITDGWVENEAQFKEALRVFHADVSEAEFEDAFRKKKLNHLMIDQAKTLGEKVGAKKTVVLHVSHACAPHEELSKKYDSKTFQIGKDRLVLTV